MKLFHFSPLTEKRLQRFKRSHVASWSLKLLVVLYLISLCSELICNNKPLLMKFNGKYSFPFLQAQPAEEIKAAAGDNHHVDYRKFVDTETFKKDSSNFALFAPIPYAPGETLDTADLEQDKRVTIALIPAQPLGRCNITHDMEIVRQDSCEQFFPGSDLRDRATSLADLIEFTPELRQELNRRLLGEACDAYETIVKPLPTATVPWTELMLTLAPNEQDIIPQTLRVNLRYILPNNQRFLPKLEYTFVHGENNAAPVYAKDVQKPADAELDALLQSLAPRAFTKDLVMGDALSYQSTESGVKYAIRSMNNIRFPFPPSRHHILGLDGSGRDVFARILYATRIAMSFGLVLAFAATILGLIVGAIQGYFGGVLDICVQRFTEIWASLPFLYIMIFVGAVFGRSFWLLLLCYGLFCWIGLSYYMRAEFLRLRSRPFVDAARCQGLGNTRIIFRHILPNALTPIITLFPFLLVGAISSLVSLDFLGFGLPPLTPSWGELLNQAQTYRWAWWLILFPSLTIFIVMFLTVMVGEGVRNAFDPKPFSKLQ